MSTYVRIPDDIAGIFTEALRGIDSEPAHPTHRDHPALLTTALVCKAWNNELSFREARRAARVILPQQERMKAVFLHLEKLNQLVRRVGHTFEGIAPDLRNFDRTEQRLNHAWNGADWTEMYSRLDRLRDGG